MLLLSCPTFMEIPFWMHRKQYLHYFWIANFCHSHLMLCLFSVSLHLLYSVSPLFSSIISFFSIIPFKKYFICLHISLIFPFSKVLHFFLILHNVIVLCRGFLVHSSSKKHFVILKEGSLLLPACKPAGFFSVMCVSLASH